MRTLVGLSLLAVALFLALYGLFALLYTGEGDGGDTYVTLAGHRLDAGLVGALALLVAFFVVLLALPFLRRR